MRLHDRVADFVLDHLAGEALDHADGVLRAGDDQVEFALLHRGAGRHHDQLAVHAAEADRRVRLQGRDLGDVQRGARADHRQDVRVVLAVGREDRAVDLDFVEVIDGEQRAGGAVDHPRGKRLFGARAGFALDEAAGELTGGVGPLAVLHLEGEEGAAGDGVPGDDGTQDDGVLVPDEDRPVGLLRDLTGFEGEGPTTEWDFDRTMADRHGVFPFR